jgi:thiamine pyrophosphate-dependent acetolactate synthase large subunit-like protein
VYVLAGNTIDATLRRPGVEWAHSVQDAAAMVRDFIKWDDLPASLQHFAESAVRAYKIAMTPPMMPVLLVADGALQEDPVSPQAALRIPKLTLATPPQGDSAAVAEAARWLVAAESPVIVADRAARTQAGMARIVELAEALQAPVIDQGGRLNFPTRHALNHSDRARELVSAADVILASSSRTSGGRSMRIAISSSARRGR